MEQSKALHKLAEASDLMLMLEDMLSSETVDKIAPTSWSGIRIIMKSVREAIQQSHGSLAQELISRSKDSQQLIGGLAAKVDSQTQAVAAVSPITQQSADGTGRVTISRRDLKASLERFIEAQ